MSNNMKLSKNFPLEELIRSATAAKLNINNNPSEKEINNLKILCKELLQPLRDELKEPIIVTSGFRCKELNKAVGGSKTSDHMKGKAVDFILSRNSNYTLDDVFDILGCDYEFKQLILEESKGRRWIHVSYDENDLRNDIMLYSNNQYIKLN